LAIINQRSKPHRRNYVQSNTYRPSKTEKITTDGETRIGPWFWLRDVDDPETMEYLKAENAFNVI